LGPPKDGKEPDQLNTQLEKLEKFIADLGERPGFKLDLGEFNAGVGLRICRTPNDGGYQIKGFMPPLRCLNNDNDTFSLEQNEYERGGLDTNLTNKILEKYRSLAQKKQQDLVDEQKQKKKPDKDRLDSFCKLCEDFYHDLLLLRAVLKLPVNLCENEGVRLTLRVPNEKGNFEEGFVIVDSLEQSGEQKSK